MDKKTDKNNLSLSIELSDEDVHCLGYPYAVMPAAAGASIMLAVALLVNNIPKTRRYPEFWL